MKIPWNIRENSVFFMGDMLLLSLVCLYCFGSFGGIHQVNAANVLVVLGVGAALGGLKLLRGRMKGLWALLLAAGVLVLGGVWGERLETVRTYLLWLANKPGWKAEYIPIYEMLQTAVYTAAVFCFQSAGEKRRRLRAWAGVALCLYLAVCVFLQKEISHWGMVFTAAYLMLLYLEWLYHRGAGQGERSPVLWLTPFAGIYLALMMILPAPKEPFRWQFARDIARLAEETAAAVAQQMEWAGGRPDFGAAFAGFSDGGSPFGNLLSGDREVMELTVEAAQRTNIYLTGSVFDTFDGSEWSRVYEPDAWEREIDALETLYAVRRDGEGYLRNYLYQTKIGVELRNFKTEYVFAPLKSYRASGWAVRKTSQDSDGAWRFDKKLGYGTEYEVQYWQMNLDAPDFNRMLERQQGYAYGGPGEDNGSLLHELQFRYSFFPRSMEAVTEEDLAEREAVLYNRYASPVELSGRVRAYLDKMVSGADTDLEKLKAIESSFSDFYYTTSPGELPEDVDFLEYFLLENPRGYCTYYATAFVLLARAQGFPARYVQGFCVPVGTEKTVSVRSGMAHAWPEVYLSGIGWIPFEPTPGYTQMRYQSWETVSLEPGGSQEDNKPQETQEPAALPEEKEIVLEGLEERPGLLLPVLVPMLLLAALGGALLGLDALWGRHRYRRMTPEEKRKLLLEQNLALLAVMGYSLERGETLSELRERIAGDTAHFPSLEFVECYEMAEYGACKADPALVGKMEQGRRLLLEELKRRTGKKYIWYRLKLMLAFSFYDRNESTPAALE